jgi:hypothetical protein
MCVRNIDFVFVSSIFRLDFVFIPTVWYLLFFILLQNWLSVLSCKPYSMKSDYSALSIKTLTVSFNTICLPNLLSGIETMKESLENLGVLSFISRISTCIITSLDW